MTSRPACGDRQDGGALVRRPRRVASRLLLTTPIAALVWLAGCVTTATPRTYSLLPTPATEAASAPPVHDRPDATPLPVEVEAVALPSAVDQPQWLLRLPDQRLVLLEQTQWLSPLGDELRTALRDSLARRWATTAEQPPVWRLRLVLSRVESALGREAFWIRCIDSSGSGDRPRSRPRRAPGGRVRGRLDAGE